MSRHARDRLIFASAPVIAFIDESILMKRNEVYVMAAVIADGDLDGHREAIRAVLPRSRRRRWHWHSEEHHDRCSMLDMMSSLDLRFVVSWSVLADHRRQERARSITLRRMLWEFRRLHVSTAVFEYRQPGLNRRDQNTIDHAVRSGHASGTLRYNFASSADEPMLWAADALAGTARAAVGENDPDFLQRLGDDSVTITEAVP